jgi:diacylglycerol kinase family enzyme
MVDASDNAPIAVIVNPGARAGGDFDAGAVGNAFAAHGRRMRLYRVQGGRIADAVREALDAGARIVVAAGGDGTVNAVAGALLDRPESTLGVLPIGTLNHFARDLGIPTDLGQAVALIAAAPAREVDVGEVNGRCFLNNSSLGLYARMVVQREFLQRHSRFGKWRAMARAGWSVWRRPDTLSVALDIDGRELCRRTPFVFVGNNEYAIEGARAGTRKRLDAGALSVYLLRPRSPWGLGWLALRALAGRIERDRDLDHLDAASVVVETDGGRAPVARDGEVDELEPPLHYRIRARALRVIAPPAGASA